MSLDFDSARLRDPNLRPEHEEWRVQLRRFIDREINPPVDAWEEAIAEASSAASSPSTGPDAWSDS